MGPEDSKGGDSSESGFASDTSSDSRGSKTRYTSTNLIEPAGQMLNDIEVAEESLNEIRARLERFAASQGSFDRRRTLCDPTARLKGLKRSDYPTSLLSVSQVRESALRAEELYFRLSTEMAGQHTFPRSDSEPAHLEDSELRRAEGDAVNDKISYDEENEHDPWLPK
jgi:hypothetical protein